MAYCPILGFHLRELAVHKLLGLLVATLVFCPAFNSEAKERKAASDGGDVNIGAERPFDAVNIFGDFGKKFLLPNADENKIWWERMVRGEVGKDRFLILCALKDGNWENLGDIRTYLEFKIQETYSVKRLAKMLVLMNGKHRGAKAGRPRIKNIQGKSGSQDGSLGEGWLEKDTGAGPWGIDSQWRIEPSVYPLLYFLLMGCPGDDRCE